MDETDLPENGSTQEEPVPEKRYITPVPVEKPKLKTHAGYLVAGLLAPLALSLLTGAIGLLLSNIADAVLSPVVGVLGLGEPILFAGILVAFLVGKQNGNVKLMSFGKGGLIAYAVTLLLGLLAFGSCMVLGVAGGLLGG